MIKSMLSVALSSLEMLAKFYDTVGQRERYYVIKDMIDKLESMYFED